MKAFITVSELNEYIGNLLARATAMPRAAEMEVLL